MQFDRGYLSPYFINNQDNMQAEIEDPFILLVDKKISNIREMLPCWSKWLRPPSHWLLLPKMLKARRWLLWSSTTMRGIVKVAACKAPGFGDRRKAMLQDIAIPAGGTVISEEVGLDLESTTLEHSGNGKARYYG